MKKLRNIRTRDRLTRPYAPLLLFAVLLCALPAAGRDYYVATDGNDDNSGASDAPFATLHRARDEIRNLKTSGELPAEGVTVRIRGGFYHVETPLDFSEEDSGLNSAGITYRAQENEDVILSGGVPVSEFGLVDDASVLERLSIEARKHVFVADLRSQGITNYGHLKEQGSLAQTEPGNPWPAMELSFDGEIMQLARWPNKGFARVDQLWPVTLGNIVRSNDERVPGGLLAYRYTGDQPARWVDEADPWTHGYHGNDWDDWYSKITSIDPPNRVITLSEIYSTQGPGIERSHRWYGLNLLCELDSAGEYYIDRDKGLLYFWPPHDINKGTATVSLTSDLIRVNGASYVTFRGLTLEGCRANAITVLGGDHVSVIGCTIRNLGRAGVYMNGGTNHRVAGCDIYDVGDAAIQIVDAGDRKSLTRADHYVENNHIYRPGRIVRCHRAAVLQSGVGVYSRHNLIHDTPGQAFISSGNDLLIEYNELSNCTFENRDSANIVGTHTVIRWNFLHHLYAGSSWTRMIYLDVFTADAFIFGNVFYACYGGQAIHIGGARYNTIENNVFADCHPALWIDNRTGGIWGEDMKSFNYKEPPWSVRYPRFVYMNEEGPLGGAPLHTRIAHNICWGPWDDFVDDPSREVTDWKQNLIVDEDPGFSDAGNMDFTFPEDRAKELLDEIHFVPIPFDEIGCVSNTERVSWPVPKHIKPEPPQPYIVKVPYRPEPITVDGKDDEWEDVPRCPIKHDMSGGFLRLCWSEDALYGFVTAKDPIVSFETDIPWYGDAIMIYIEPDCARRKTLVSPCRAFALSNRHDLDTGECQISEWDWEDEAARYPTSRSIGVDPTGITGRWTSSDEGYHLEFAVPVEAMELTALQDGKDMGFNAVFVDNTFHAESFYAPEYPTTEDPFTWGRIRLVREEGSR